MNERFSFEPLALLPAAMLLYLGSLGEIAAVLLPVLVHELGHAAALALLGLRIRQVRFELRGFCIEYYGDCSAVGHAFAAFAGPLAGLVWAIAASARGNGADWLTLSAGVSVLLSLFNLLPALPLDGGRILLALSCALWGERRGARLTEGASLLTGALLLGAGVWLLLRGRGAALLTAAVWLLLFQEDGRGLVKRREMISNEPKNAIARSGGPTHGSLPWINDWSASCRAYRSPPATRGANTIRSSRTRTGRSSAWPSAFPIPMRSACQTSA